MSRYGDDVDDVIEEAMEAARGRRYEHLSPDQLRRRLARAEDSRRALGNLFWLCLIACYVMVFRKELIQVLTKLGELAGDG